MIDACAEYHDQKSGGTWISEQMSNAYKEFNKLGYSISVEAWDSDILVGGLYGVQIGRMFAGESMFSLVPNVSKLAFLFLIEQLETKKITWIDCQQSTPFSRSFGANQIIRDDYLKLLIKSL